MPNQNTTGGEEAKTFYEIGQLSAAERSAVRQMRALKPFVKIEIKLKDNKPGEISVVSTATIREDFPVDMI